VAARTASRAAADRERNNDKGHRPVALSALG
jgi:hypothetical protein